MKLLLDENLSPRLVELLAANFPGSTHIEHLKIRGATDAAIWAYARDTRKKLWEMPLQTARRLGLENRIVSGTPARADV